MTIYNFIVDKNPILGEWLEYIRISTEPELSDLRGLLNEMNLLKIDILETKLMSNISYLKMLDVLNEMNYLDSICVLNNNMVDTRLYILMDLFNILNKDLIDTGAAI